MKYNFPFYIFIFFLISCQTNHCNLNKSLGWEKIDPNDFIVINIHWTKNKKDSSDLQFKREFDEAVLVEFQSEKLGDQGANDAETETDYNFIIQRNYQPALNAIVKIAGEYKIERNIIVNQREYIDGATWVDKPLYPKK